LNKLFDNKHVLILCRLHWDKEKLSTLGNHQRLNKEDKVYIYIYLNMIQLNSFFVFKSSENFNKF
jgi:hypothetical protein